MKELKKTTTKTEEDLLKLKKAEDLLRQQLIEGADFLIKEKGTDESLDKRLEKIELLSGDFFNLKEYQNYIGLKISEYQKRFPQDFYKEVFRLNGWKIPQSGMISQKPSIVGIFTKQIIYGRFPKEILPVIESKNPYDKMGMRAHKHFQFLSPGGVQLLEKFIEESITIMKQCTYWGEFVEKHAIKYGQPFQKSLFPYGI